MAELGKYFLKISLDLRQGKYKGLTMGEINKIDDLVAAVLNGAMAGNAEAILQRTDKFIEKYVSSPEITDKNKDLATLAGASGIGGEEGEEDIPIDTSTTTPSEEEPIIEPDEEEIV